MFTRMIRRMSYPVLVAGVVLLLLSVVDAVMAGNIDGMDVSGISSNSANRAVMANIDETNKYAWGSNVGWINFNPEMFLLRGTAQESVGVTVYDDHLEGYAWGENVGWIRLGTHSAGGVHTYANSSSTDYGVNNNGSGMLSGYAWGSNVGWINFDPTNGGVTIDPSTGSFSGDAWAENVGWIRFKNDGDNPYNVVTDWRAESGSDTAGVLLSSGSVNATEGGSSASYTVALTSPPTDTVTISVAAADSQSSVSSAELTFTTADWHITQTLTITATDDNLAEGIHSGTITHAANSEDTNYDGIDIGIVTVNITDNDHAGVWLSSTSLNATEGGTTDSYSVKLTSQPTDTVTISLNVEDQISVTATVLTFTTTDWNIAQPLTVTATNDGLVERDHDSTITHVVSSNDIKYHQITTNSVVVNITENDTPGVSISSTRLSTTEGGPSALYMIALTTEPTDEVSISLASNDQINVTSDSLTFTTENWNTAQTVTVVAEDDGLVEGNHDSTITATATSNDTHYEGISINSVTVDITDNDTAGVSISSTKLNATEGDINRSYTVVLTTQPTHEVQVSLASDSQTSVTVSPATLTFTTQNWNQLQTVSVTAVDNDLDGGNYDGRVIHAATSQDNYYNGIGINEVTVSIVDNDSAGVSISSTDLNATEGGTDGEYTIALTTEPSEAVTVSLTSDTQINVNPATLTFTSANWNAAQNVTVSAVDDKLAESSDNHNSTITAAATSNDTRYDNIGISSVAVSITDNDSAGVSISSTRLSATEGETNASYTVMLTTEPTETVTVSVISDTQTSVSPTELTFTAADWDSAQTVTVTPLNDDLAESNHNGTVTHRVASGDSNYSGLDVHMVEVNITDNDSPAVWLSSTSLSATEGDASGSYIIGLTTEPTDVVTISLTSDTQISMSPATFTFTPANWNAGQSVTVSAVDDYIAEPNHNSTITTVATSNDNHYDRIPISSATVRVTDNDTAGVSISRSAVSATEGGFNGSYTVVLTSEPIQEVTVSVISDTQSSVNPAQLTFTPTDWNSPRTVSVTAEDDNLAEGYHNGTVTHSASSGDANYNGIVINPVTVNITDNDSPGVSLSSTGASATEGGADGSYRVMLTTQPSDEVIISLTTDSEVKVVATSAVTFTIDNWNIAQTVSVTAIDDSWAEGYHNGTVTHAATSNDINYNMIPISPVTVNVTDNDSAGVSISSASVSATEGGADGSYTIRLTTEPTDTVNITLGFHTQISVTAATLTFTTANWDATQPVTVTASDDNLVEGNHNSTITASATSNDTDYHEIPISSVTVDITDNDSAGVSISSASVSATEGGSSGSYTVVLTTQPTDPVTISVPSHTQTEVTPNSLIFTTANWDEPQIVSVTAIDDRLVEGHHNETITHNATSSDSHYDGIGVSVVTVNITDNDTAGVLFSSGNVNLTEGGSSGSYTIALTTEPTDTVTISLDSDSQTRVEPATLTFTTANSDTVRTVTVSAVDDNLAEGNHSGTISATASSNDAHYNGVPISPVTVSITDNDSAGVSLSSATVSATEGGADGSYTVALTTKPTQTVSILLTSDGQTSATPTELIFTTDDWNTDRTVTVSATDDHLAEGNHHDMISATATSSDTNYNGIGISQVTVSITDNDSAGVSLSPTSLNMTEGDSDFYTVTLTTKPTDTVSITLTSDTQINVAPTTLTFTTANWNAAQVVSVTAVDDDVAEGRHYDTITHAATSSDIKYNGIEISSVSVGITDNDDDDEDGAANKMEDRVPNANGSGTGDGNGDGMPDSEQKNVASLPNSMTGEFVTLIVDDELSLTGVYAMQSLPEVPEEANFEQGYFDFGVTGLSAGDSFTVSFMLHSSGDEKLPNSYWKYGPTPDNPSDHWYDFQFDGTTGAQIEGNIVTLHFVDGARGDDDLTPNGQISDPGGPAISRVPTALELTHFDSQQAIEWPKWLLVSMSMIAGALLWRRRRN